jgi:hypothetical protein
MPRKSVSGFAEAGAAMAQRNGVQTHANVDRASQSPPSTMLAVSFSRTRANTVTTAKWLGSGPTS